MSDTEDAMADGARSSNDLRAESPVPMPPPQEQAPPPVDDEETRARLDKVMQSDIGIATLLNRLKQSIASARDFSTFLRKRSSLEEEHAQGLKKLCRATNELVRRPEHRQGTYASSHDETTRIHDRMAENGMAFAMSLHQMSDELQDLASSMERGRKHWKQSGLNAEKRVQDSEAIMEKAKSKYDSLAEQYDRARTGDRQSGRFGLKGTKSAAQQEEDLHKKVQAADSDYMSKVQTAQSQRQELVSTLRPQAVRALHDLIYECDSGLSQQLQKFAMLNERLLLGNGLCVSPLKNQANGVVSQNKSLREVAQQVDNEKDFKDYILSFSGKAGSRPSEIKYEKHPALSTPKQAPPPVLPQPSFAQSQPSLPSPVGPNQSYTQSSQPGQVTGVTSSYPPRDQSYAASQPYSQPPPAQSPRQFSGQYPPVPPSGPSHQDQTVMSGGIGRPNGFHQQTPPPVSQPPMQSRNDHLPPLNPVFGVSLEELFRRDQSAVPMIVYQCIQAVDSFGLDVEGIYRTSGSSPNIQQMKQMFDNGQFSRPEMLYICVNNLADPQAPDFRNPASFFHDVNSVTGLLKLFFRSLPDPLLTSRHYSEFISAARLEDDIVRRDTLHAIVNALPDPNYATLRVMMLHLWRVQERSERNRMTVSNLAICLGPTLVGGAGARMEDTGFQSRVVETVLSNTFQIFDDDD
ncbi:MAG: hypothetical protein Q9227_006528 [Pyrenula ochraceoflavens]